MEMFEEEELSHSAVGSELMVGKHRRNQKHTGFEVQKRSRNSESLSPWGKATYVLDSRERDAEGSCLRGQSPFTDAFIVHTPLLLLKTKSIALQSHRAASMYIHR